MTGSKPENPPVDAHDKGEDSPEDARVTASRAGTGEEVEENEVLRETRRATDLRAKAERAAKKVGWKTAAGIGIGSAAVLAAALYANRKKD